MAEPAPAKRVGTTSHTIIVSLNGTPNPENTDAALSDEIYFNVNPGPAVDLWTYDNDGDLNNIFASQTNNYEALKVGLNGPYTFNTNVVSVNDSLSFEANSNPPDEKRAGSGTKAVSPKGTIKITSHTDTAAARK